MSSTKDPFQNVDNPEAQAAKRVKQIDAAATRRAENQSRIGGGDLVEALNDARLLNEAERASIYEQQPQDWHDRARALRYEPDPPVATVVISDTEETPVEEDTVAIADEDAEAWLAIKDRVEAVVEDIHDQLPREMYCRITVELLRTVDKQRPDHLVEALDWLAKRGQGVVTETRITVKPENRCAQHLTDDGCFVRFEFADMDASTHPS
jgi:hypothetical protein